MFTAEQANYGKNVFMGACVSCHSPGDYQGGAFYAGLIGTKIAKLFKYLRENMPQDNPGALADEDYAAAIAYILQLNQAPAGTKPLPADSTALSKITFVAPSTPPHHFSTGR